MDRRTVLKIAGLSSLAAATGCSPPTDKYLYALVEAPDDMVTGKANWYASTCRECPAGCGVLAKTREGRVIKLEGNPAHPINQGTLCLRGQSALQGVYNPDRLTKPVRRSGNDWQVMPFDDAHSLLRAKLDEVGQSGALHVMTELVGDALMSLLEKLCAEHNAATPLVFEPMSYDSLRAANELVFGRSDVCSYRMERADFLLSFGADFLETWLSPVEYARKFTQMRLLHDGKKNPFVHISPYQSLTAANADEWMSCIPGSELTVVLGLISAALALDRGTELDSGLRSRLVDLSAAYTPDHVATLSGVSADRFNRLAERLFQAQQPLILPAGAGAISANDPALHVAVNLLNAILDPDLSLFDFSQVSRISNTTTRSDVSAFFEHLTQAPEGLVLLNNVNPVYTLPKSAGTASALGKHFVIAFSNFLDETSNVADLVIPIGFALETWDEYGAKEGLISTLQPAMGKITHTTPLGDLLLASAFQSPPAPDYKSFLFDHLFAKNAVTDKKSWLRLIRNGGQFDAASVTAAPNLQPASERIGDVLRQTAESADLTLIASPSLRFWDGRGANRPWLTEFPDPLTKVAWQTPVIMHADTAAGAGIRQGQRVSIKSEFGEIEAPAYVSPLIRPGVLLVSMGQGHRGFGRYADGVGANPLNAVDPNLDPISGAPRFFATGITLTPTGRREKLAHTDGSRIQHDRKIALSIGLKDLGHHHDDHGKHHGLAMHDFPLTLPLPEGYDKERDFYPAHDHEGYRWAMVVDLDRCIGCGACSVACYAENNLGVVGVDRILDGREMSWIRIERYHDPDNMEKVIFLPMMCQHCDNAPCESVCPVYAPHHSKEGLNNQIYNRCIGTRYCAQNCPYKVRRFNWFDWKWPDPLNLQLNPEVTVRSKGVMEKCSFCIQRIKHAHGHAKDENRRIRDGEVKPACLQTCPTSALTFGNLMDPESKVRHLVEDERAYQVMGYLNTKPAVIYLKKVVQTI